MKPKVLFVDDEINILNSFKRNLRKRFEIETSTCGAEALKVLRHQGPFEIVVSDMKMPVMNGAVFLAKVRNEFPDTVRIMLTGQTDLKTAISAVNDGFIFHFLTKPCPNYLLIQTLNSAVKHSHLIHNERELFDKTLKSSIKLLVDIIAMTRPREFNRALRVKEVASKLASYMDIKDMWQVDIAAMLSPIVNITLPVETLEKKYSGQKLSAVEEEMLLKRNEVSRDLISNIPRLEEVGEIIFWQEKKYNGEGFPDINKSGTSIPLISRILKIASDYGEMLSAGKSHGEAISKIHANSSWYDPEILEILQNKIAPPGEKKIIVNLKTNEIKIGMIVGEDVLAKNGTILVPKDQEITEISLRSITNFAKSENIIEPIKIIKTE